MNLAAMAPIVLLSAVAITANAQTETSNYPSKPVRIVVGLSPGGSTDVLARLVARELQKSMSKPFIVENKPSTGAIIGAITTAKAAPDGYTLMLAPSGPMVFNPVVYRNLPYSPQKDFVPISLVAKTPLILAVKQGSGISTVDELINFTKNNPNTSNYSASSAAFQLASEMFKQQTGATGTHIPYKGSSDAIMSVASGEVSYTMADPGPAAGAIKGNLIRGLAITSDKRMPLYPSIPTFKESGIDLQVQVWLGIFAPSGTSPEIIDRLQKEIVRAVDSPEVKNGMEQLGVIPATSTSTELSELMAKEINMWTTLIKRRNIKVE